MPSERAPVRRTSSLSQHPPNGMDWAANRHPSTLSPISNDTTWDFSPSHKTNPTWKYAVRNFGWFAASITGRDGLFAASMASNPRGDSLPQFWMLQRGVVVFLALSFNACLSQALRSEPDPEKIDSLLLWRISSSFFTLGSLSALCAVGVFAWIGITFAHVSKKQFPSFVSQNGGSFQALLFVHFIAFVTAMLGTFVRILAQHPFWGRRQDPEWSSQMIGISAVVSLAIFLYGVVALMNLFSVTICDQNGFEDQPWPGLTMGTNKSLQRHHQKMASRIDSPDEDWLLHADPSDVSEWLNPLSPQLADTAEKEYIDGSALLEMKNMTATEASVYFSSLFPSCPRGLYHTLWKEVKRARSSIIQKPVAPVDYSA